MDTIPKNQRFEAKEAHDGFTTAEAKNIAKKFIPQASEIIVSKLIGGFSNLNFLLVKGNQKYILRFYTGGLQIAERETGILRFLRKSQVKTPKLIDYHFESGAYNVALLEFVEGKILNDVTEIKAHAAVGLELAKIHQIKFDRAGLLGKNALVKNGCPEFCSFIKTLTYKALSNQAGRRLGDQTKEKLQNFIEEHWPLVEETYEGPGLTHCDFNPKNIILQENQPVVIDWEFALSGHHLFDIGNFLRFEEDYSDEARKAFLTGYRDGGGHLHKESLLAAKVLDLANLCEFLDRPKEYPKTFYTAKTIISRTLNQFSGRSQR